MDSIAAVSARFHFPTTCAKLTWIFQSARIVLHIQREMALHLDYCASFGLSKQEMEAHPETVGKSTCDLELSLYLVALFVQ